MSAGDGVRVLVVGICTTVEEVAVSNNVAVAAVVEAKLLEEEAARERDMELVVLGRWGCWRAPTSSNETPARRKRKPIILFFFYCERGECRSIILEMGFWFCWLFEIDVCLFFF